MTDSTRIIDLSELRGRDGLPRYVAVCSDSISQADALSPELMQWNERVFLSRLDSCRTFWLERKKKLRCKLGELFDPVLYQHFGSDYIAVFADHPWQALLLLQYQINHQGRGLYFLDSRLYRNLFKSLDWACWFEAQQDLATHLSAINARGFDEDNFRARQAQLKRFIDRIGVRTPFQMHQADRRAMTRRFGKWLGNIWQWSFHSAQDLDWFPWIRYQGQVNPAVRRDLEYPVTEWHLIESLLREDLQRLRDNCLMRDCDHINRMPWTIHLFNHRQVTVDLSFRHPYSLHRDAPGFETALYQARYIFDDLMSRLRLRDSDLDLPETMPFIAWRIEISERISLTPQLWELFSSESDHIDYQQVQALQNKLPVAFESYLAAASFFPESSFCTTPIGQSPGQVFDHLQWHSSAVNKPLFYYDPAIPIEPPNPVRRFFLERNAMPWWLGEDALQSIRDYFLLRDDHGRASWAFRDPSGDWYKQGEFC